MKFLKFFNSFFNEAIINPLDYDGFFDDIDEFTNNNKKISFEILNKIGKRYNLKFMNYDDFYNSLETDAEKKCVSKTRYQGGFYFACVDKRDKNIITAVIEKQEFINYITGKNGMSIKNMMKKFINMVLRHESIHVQQLNKYQNMYSTDASPFNNPKKYFSNPAEIMAYAQSSIDEMIMKGKSKNEIKTSLRGGKHNSDIKSDYKNMDKTVYQKFLRYCFDYLNQLPD